MSSPTSTLTESPAEESVLRSRRVALILPVALLVALVGILAFSNPAQHLDNGAPAAEEISFERVELRAGEISFRVRNAAATEVTIAQVIVDDAFWAFEAAPSTTLGRYDRATITVEYPWVEGEPHVVGILTNTGLLWEHEIPVAIETPVAGPAAFRTYALIGLLVGVLPVAAGMAFFPVLREAPRRHLNAILAFTLGLLAFLAVDTVEDGLELSGEIPGAFQGLALFAGAALLAILGVLAIERGLRSRGTGAATLAVLIAIGIGLHNLGEGLLIGSAFALGSLALGSTLILGFALHNVTEGPAIVAPLARDGRLPWARFLGLAALAGLPTVAGAWIGAFASGGVLPVVFFGLGAGAILVVFVQLAGAMRRQEGGLVTTGNLVAFAVGYGIMLATGLLLAP